MPQIPLVPAPLAALLLPIASVDPMEHVFDHPFSPLGALGSRLGITWHVVMLWVAAALCLLIFPAMVRRIQVEQTAGRMGHLFEVILLFMRDEMARPFLGKEGDKYLPIVWSFFFFILFCNLLGLIPGSTTPTGNINVTAALAVISFCTYHSIGIYHNGIVHYLKANLLIGPPYLWPLMIVIEIAGHIIRPCALAIRLFANMVAGHTLLAVLIGFALVLTKSNLIMGSGVAVVAVLSGIAITFLELLVAFIQAFIFTFLTTVFLAMAIHPEH